MYVVIYIPRLNVNVSVMCVFMFVRLVRMSCFQLGMVLSESLLLPSSVKSSQCNKPLLPCAEVRGQQIIGQANGD